MKTLREHRNERLLSIRSLAEAAGCSSATVLRIELRRIMPTHRTMKCLAEALGCEVGEVAEFQAALVYRSNAYRVPA